jgi:hypothetical protein
MEASMSVNTMTRTDPFIRMERLRMMKCRDDPPRKQAGSGSQLTREDLLVSLLAQLPGIPLARVKSAAPTASASPGATPLDPVEFDLVRQWKRKPQRTKTGLRPPPLPTKTEKPPWEHTSETMEALFPGEDEETCIQFEVTAESARIRIQKLLWLCLGMATGTLAVLLSMTFGGW